MTDLLKIFRNKSVQWTLKLLILILLLWFSYQQIFRRADFSELLDTFQQALSPQFYLMLIGVLIMMLVNWSLEAEKWRRLMIGLEKLSFRKALSCIFAGITLASFTPNRIGEYGGRLWLLKKADVGETIAVTILGSLSQLLITFLMGSIGLIIYVGMNPGHLGLNAVLISSILIPISLGALYLYFRPEKLLNLLPKASFFNKVREKAKVLYSFDYQSLKATLLFSFTRYLVFAAQYLIFLWMFGVDINSLTLILLIMQIFLLQTIVPSFAVTELGIRGGIAISLLGPLSSNSLGILSASFGLWIINLMIPAIIGMIIIFRNNIRTNK